MDNSGTFVNVSNNYNSKKKMKPIGKYILIKKVDEEIETASGLVLSAKDASDIRYRKGNVVAVGDMVGQIKSEDVIYYDSRAGYTMMINSESFTVIRESDVVVVL